MKKPARLATPHPGSALAFLLGFALAPLATAPPASAGPAIAFAPFAGSAGCGPSNVEGWEFEALSDMTVSALGAWDDDLAGFLHPIPVGLYDSSCQLLAQATLPAGTGASLLDQYRYEGITPVDLAAGQSYRIAAVVMCDDRSPGFSSLADVSVDPALSVVQARRIPFASALACPTDDAVQLPLAPSFLIGPACGNGLVQAGEHCDDGNTTDGDCCSATCTLPAGACRAAAKSQLLLKDDARDDDARGKLVWKWKRGEPTSQAELADPTATADYAFCVYDASGLVLDAGVPASAARWSALRDQGYRYGDKSGAEDGFRRIFLRGSAEPKAKAELKGSGPNLPLPPLGSLSLPVSVQLRNEETGVCLESVFDAEDVLANDAGQFKARAR